MYTVVDWCWIFQLNKGTKQQVELYMSLPIPDKPWQHISMDFVLRFPKKFWQHDSIMVVVNHFSKMVHFIPCHKAYNASKVAEFFLQEVVRLHSILILIMSNRVFKFVSYFWKTLWTKNQNKVDVF